MCAGTSTGAGSCRGELSSLGTGYWVTRFALGPNLVVNLDVELNKSIEVLWCGLLREGLLELSVEAPSEIGNLGTALIV